MNNLKIKSYSLKKNPILEKGGGNQILTERKKEENDKKLDKEINSKPHLPGGNVPTSLINEVNKIIKTPGLNVSSKLDSKGNRLININLFEKQVKNHFNLKEMKHENEKREIMREFSETEREKEKNINIKLNINSEVINNNIKINNKSESTSHTNSDNFSTFNEMKASLVFYKELVNEKNKQIEDLTNELNKMKNTIKEQNEKMNKSTILSATLSPQNMVGGFPSFKLDLNSKLVKNEKEKLAGSEFCSERTSHNNSLIIKNLRPSENLSQSTATLNIGGEKDNLQENVDKNNIIKSKKLQTTYSNFFRKSNVNITNTLNTKSFLGGVNSLNNEYKNPKENHTVMTLGMNLKNLKEKETSPNKKFKPMDQILQSTLNKLEDLKITKLKDGGSKINFPTSSISSTISHNKNNFTTDPHPPDVLATKLNQLKLRAQKLLNVYSDLYTNIKNKK